MFDHSMRTDHLWMTHLEKEREPPFCGNPECLLYVRAGDEGVFGSGNWAVLADGRIIGRVLCGGIYLCDTCAREWFAVAVFEPGGSALRESVIS